MGDRLDRLRSLLALPHVPRIAPAGPAAFGPPDAAGPAAHDGQVWQFSFEAPPELTGQITGTTYGRAPRVSREDALAVPAVLAARNKIAGTLGRLSVRYLDGRNRQLDHPLFRQPDPDMPRSVMFAHTYEDLLFEGWAWWRVIGYDAADYPIAGRFIPESAVTISPNGSTYLRPEDRISPEHPFPETGRVLVNGVEAGDRELIRFDSPNPPLLVHAARAIRDALALARTASMYSDSPTGLGYFTTMPEAEEMEDDEIIKYLDDFEAARKARAWGYVGKGLLANKLSWSPEELQLADARQHVVLEIARATGLDPEDLGVSTTSRTYQNNEQRRQDLVDMCLANYGDAIGGRLSMYDVARPGHSAHVAYDEFVRGDTLTRMTTYEVGQRVGAFDRDLVRRRERLPLDQDGDRPASRSAADVSRETSPASIPEDVTA